MKKAPLVGAFFVSALLFCGGTRADTRPACGAAHIDEWSRVAAVYDGDTLRLSDGRVIRFIGINAPELAHDGREAQPLAAESKQALMQLLPPGARVGLRFDTDRHDHYHRTLAHVFEAKGRNVSALLLRRGLAFAIAITPNLWQSACYFRQESLARAKQRGVWRLDYYRPRDAGSIRGRKGGFFRARGRIDHIGRSRHSLWLDMGPGFAVRIPRKRLAAFSALSIDTWLHKIITVRGWARFYNGKLNMTITHPAMIEAKP